MPQLPLAPLVHAYRQRPTRQATPMVIAVETARVRFLNIDFLDGASEDDFRIALEQFQTTIQPFAGLIQPIQQRNRYLRMALQHWLHAIDSPGIKLDRCLIHGGPFVIAGLGFGFWSGIVKALQPTRWPWWNPTIEEGLCRFGFGRTRLRTPGDRLAHTIDAYQRLHEYAPDLDAHDWDALLTQVAFMRGREFHHNITPVNRGTLLRECARRERNRYPLRLRLSDAKRQLTPIVSAATHAIQAGDCEAYRAAVLPLDSTLRPLDEPEWADYLAHQDATLALHDKGQAWLAIRNHLGTQGRAPIWDDVIRTRLAPWIDGFDQAQSPGERYQLYVAAVEQFAERLRLHPTEIPDLFRTVRIPPPFTESSQPIIGFCRDSVEFLHELTANNERAWMEQERERYQFAIRAPMLDLCQRLGEQYVMPILRGEHGWDIEANPRIGRALSSICKNDYGRSSPYQPELWITFYCRNEIGKRAAVQLFVRLDAKGLHYGWHLSRTARESGRLFRRAVQEYADTLFAALQALIGHADFIADDEMCVVTDAGKLREWAAGKTLEVRRTRAGDDPLLQSEDLLGEMILLFQRILPLYACAVESNPLEWLRNRTAVRIPQFDAAAFQRATHLPSSWLPACHALLMDKPQLILHGVPGTGKTHIARALARRLTDDRPGAIRLVQFHPAYNYEEFVEGIRAKTIEVNGRNEVSYPVEEGVLLTFAAEAQAEPEHTFVLLIDEINRGNLPRILGELFYSLEYRDQPVTLPYSRRQFQLPPNLWIIGTMNGQDRSIVALDGALRRRFNFVEMVPDAALLARWLMAYPPQEDEPFAAQVVAMFERVNAQLAEDLGATQQIGHSYWMQRDLTEEMLHRVWDHQIHPQIRDMLGLQPARLTRYTWEQVWNPTPRRRRVES